MRKPLKIILCTAALLLAVGAAAAAWQWENLMALRYLSTSTAQTMAEDIARNDQQLKDVLDQYQVSEYTFSKDELTAIADDEDELEKAAEVLLQKPEFLPPPIPSSQTTRPPTIPAQAPAKPVPSHTASAPKKGATDYTGKIRAQLAKMYILRATYVSQLENVVSGAKAEYIALAPAERTDAKKQELVIARVDTLSSMEKRCDREVAAVVSELRRLLKADGQDGSLADLVEQTYAEEKRLKKAYYISEFQK